MNNRRNHIPELIFTCPLSYSTAMHIHYDVTQSQFSLQAGNATYALKVSEQGILQHVYWGPQLSTSGTGPSCAPIQERGYTPNLAGAPNGISLDTLPQEFPTYGNSDFREPALEIFQPETGSRILSLRYKSHTISSGKPKLEGLPSTYAEVIEDAETLTILLEDTRLQLQVELHYTVFPKHPIITRSARILNKGKQNLEIRRALSASVDFDAELSDYKFVQLSGAWIRERNAHFSTLRPGVQAISSQRGTSSHQQNPFFALAEKGANETDGSVYAYNLIYSGNFLAQVEQDQFQCVRAQIGINPFDFTWQLKPGSSFQAPEVVMTYAADGLGGMSRAMHRFYRQHLLPIAWRDQPRPILLNNWEATYFDFDAKKIETIAASGAELGVELFVLDDGWFGRRDNDRTSLGDWVVDHNKLPDGLENLAQKVKARGIEFGLWFEPEMVSPDSELYRSHSDWCIHVPDRPRTESRNQLVLDFSRSEVRDAIYARIATILQEVPITYVKWDMNRHLTELGSLRLDATQQQETAHRFVLGLYEIMDRFNQEFPHILFEGCSGGGGRFDPGILAYMPQIWTSDNSDAISRLRIQYGTSLAYPLSTMAAHVSAVPNHQVGRTTPLRTRGHVACTGAFGYELDLGTLTEAEKSEVCSQIEFYKTIRPLLISGDLYRLKSPYESQEAAWMIVSEDRHEALVTHVTVLNEPNAPARRLKLQGLSSEIKYRVRADGDSYTVSGDVLMHQGLFVPQAKTDFESIQWLVQAL